MVKNLLNDPYLKTQVKDKPELLELMLNDTKSASYLYRPTNYWKRFGKKLIPEIRKYGLHDFRRRKNSMFHTFGATDLDPIYNALFMREVNPLKIKHILAYSFKGLFHFKFFQKLVEEISDKYHDLTLRQVELLLYEMAKHYGQINGARPIQDLKMSTIGNPENTFSVEGNLYTISILHYYFMYAYCCRFFDFNSIDSMMELGSGAGKEIEIIKKLHPNLCFYVTDIPPQLYVCEQYLSAVFPESVVSYEKTRNMKKIPDNSKGKIFIIGNWKFPTLKDFNYDLFWNSTSLQEMEPDVVLNYLKFVNRQTRKFVFLHEMMEGSLIAKAEGKHGVLQQSTIDHYKRGLKDFQIADISNETPTHASASKYSFSLWKRKSHNSDI